MPLGISSALGRISRTSPMTPCRGAAQNAHPNSRFKGNDIFRQFHSAIGWERDDHLGPIGFIRSGRSSFDRNFPAGVSRQQVENWGADGEIPKPTQDDNWIWQAAGHGDQGGCHAPEDEAPQGKLSSLLKRRRMVTLTCNDYCPSQLNVHQTRLQAAPRAIADHAHQAIVLPAVAPNTLD